MPTNGDVLDGDEILEELREMIEARRLAKASINGAPLGSIIKVIQTMALDLAQERQRARAYLDCLQPEQVPAARKMLESMVSPLDRLLTTAPIDDEPVTAADRAAIEAANDPSIQSKAVTTEDILADFGLTRNEFDQLPLRPISDGTNGNG